MKRYSSLLLLATVGVASIVGRSADISSHILWERNFKDVWVSVLGTAVSDNNGGVWLITEGSIQGRLVHISPNGDWLEAIDLLPSLNPQAPANSVEFQLAVSASGKLALLARYSHAIGNAFYFDGAKFATVDPDGKVSLQKNVAETGPEYKDFIALSDDHYLALGDQDPLTIIRLDSEGMPSWRRRFPSSWVLPSAAPLPNGASCVASPGNASHQVHVIILDKSGIVLHRTEIAARRALAAPGPSGACAILFDREPTLSGAQYFLTAFDPSFRRQWTTAVNFPASYGGVFSLVKLGDGYLIAAEAESKDSLFLAKYDFSGQLVWSTLDSSRQVPSLVVPAGEGFYLINAGPKDTDPKSLDIIRGR